MGAASSGENTPKFIGPKFGILLKKGFHWASVVREEEPWFSFWTKSLA